MDLPRVVLILGLLALLLFAWLGRYEFSAHAQEGRALMYDRWTGNLMLCNIGEICSE